MFFISCKYNSIDFKTNLGFTLIELLVVIAIVGILSAIGISSFQGYKTKLKYEVSVQNHKSAFRFITAELIKCNLQSSPISFYSRGKSIEPKTTEGELIQIDACPTPSQSGALLYFKKYLNDFYESPWWDGGATDIVGSGSWGYMYFVANMSTGNLQLQTHLGRRDGDKTKTGFMDQDHLLEEIPLSY